MNLKSDHTGGLPKDEKLRGEHDAIISVEWFVKIENQPKKSHAFIEDFRRDLTLAPSPSA